MVQGVAGADWGQWHPRSNVGARGTICAPASEALEAQARDERTLTSRALDGRRVHEPEAAG